MPLHDYRCTCCNKRFTLLLGMVSAPQAEICPSCGSENVRRLISRFARLRSEDERMDSLADPSNLGDLDEPSNMAKWIKRMGCEAGADVRGDLDRIMDEAEDDGPTGAGTEMDLCL